MVRDFAGKRNCESKVCFLLKATRWLSLAPLSGGVIADVNNASWSTIDMGHSINDLEMINWVRRTYN